MGLFVDLAVQHISIESEAVIFEKLQYQFKKYSPAASKKQQKIQSLVDEIQECLDLPYPVKVHLFESPEENAVALPGGNIIVFSGILSTVHSENGLAFILAHELGHFTNRDHLRSMGRGIVLLALSNLLTGVTSDISSMLVSTGNFGQAQYSQSRESLADISALEALNCTYGHVGGATEFFQTMAANKTANSSLNIHYFSSHPQARHRLSVLKNSIKEYGYREKAVKYTP